MSKRSNIKELLRYYNKEEKSKQIQEILKRIPDIDKNLQVSIAPDVRYCFESEIDFFSGTSSDIGYFLSQTGLNVTNIFDKIENNEIEEAESKNIYKNIEDRFYKWYKTEASDLEKSVLFYKFLLGLEYQLKKAEKELFAAYDKIEIKIDKRKKFKTVIKQIEKKIKPNNQEENDWLMVTVTEEEKSINKIKDILDFFALLKWKYETYKKNTKYTFDEIMQIITIQNSIENENILNTSRNASFQNEIEEEALQNLERKKEKKVNKKEFKLMKRMLNKSIKTLESFLPSKDVNSFINGEEFKIEGKKFNYKIKKKEQYKLLQEKKSLDTYHIPYILNLYDKKDRYLANLCVVFNGCPILDQILSVYLMIQSNQEDILLDSCNFYNRSDYFETNNNIKKIIEQREDTINNSFGNNSISTVEQENVKKITQKEVIARKKYFKEKILKKIFDAEAIDFIYNTEHSWDEIKDYYSMTRGNNNNIEQFSDNRLDSLMTI